ncbi:unnamed protein product, partial [marine sediment metagenome]
MKYRVLFLWQRFPVLRTTSPRLAILLTSLACCVVLEPTVAIGQGEPEETATVSGVVTDADGQPVEHANIEGRYYRALAEAVSDAKGRFTISVPANRVGGLLIVARFDEDRQMGLHE